MRRDTPKKLDAITLLARAAVAKRRRPRLVPSLIAAAVVVALLSLLVWWAWPQPQPEFVLLAAYDAVTSPGEAATIRAQVQATGADNAGADMAGYDLYFEEPGGDWRAKAATDKHGRVVLEHAFPAAQDDLAYYLVRCPKGGRRAATPDVGGRVFLWPKESRLLVVDADQGLTDADPAQLRTANNFDIRPVPEAVAALQQTSGNYRIVYLSAAVEAPDHYLKVWSWLRRNWLPVKDQFPDGPLLARPWQPDAADGDSFYRSALGTLKERFPEVPVAVTRSVETARTFQAAGLKTFLIREAGEGPENVTALASWSELPERLAK